MGRRARLYRQPCHAVPGQRRVRASGQSAGEWGGAADRGPTDGAELSSEAVFAIVISNGNKDAPPRRQRRRRGGQDDEPADDDDDEAERAVLPLRVSRPAGAGDGAELCRSGRAGPRGRRGRGVDGDGGRQAVGHGGGCRWVIGTKGRVAEAEPVAVQCDE